MRKLAKVLLINFCVFIICVLIIEIIFGYWFSEFNLGPYMREHRLKKVPVTLLYNNETYNYLYKRNYHGFRGEEIDPEKIEAVIIGGSTTDERYKPSKFSITENLNRLLEKKGFKFKIINAGIAGQSTYGHIYNFQHWFPKLKNFSPKLYIFYIGINDQWTKQEEIDDPGKSGNVKSPKKLEAFFDNLKSRSFFSDKLRILKLKYYTTDKKVTHDRNYFIGEGWKQKKVVKDYKYINYNKALQLHDIEHLKSKYEKKISSYLNNIKILNNYTINNNALAIFITQVQFDGLKEENLFILNYSLIEYCNRENLNCIDLGKKLDGKLDFFYDLAHTTKLGSQVIAETVINDLTQIIERENLFSSNLKSD